MSCKTKDCIDSWKITVKTGTYTWWDLLKLRFYGPGTDSNVYIKLTGTKGATEWIDLDTREDDFECGETNVFYFDAFIGDFTTAQMWCGGDRWKCQWVNVEQLTGAKFCKTFKCGWIRRQTKTLPW